MDRLLPPPVDPALVAEYVELHKRGYHHGWAVRPYLPAIAGLVRKHGATSLLDYGAGKGKVWHEDRAHEAHGLPMPVCYDPAVPAFAQLPDRFYDGVICVDVLEHLPVEHVGMTLAGIRARARKFLFLAACCRPGTKTLPFSGLDVHLTVRSEKWWAERVAKFCPGIDVTLRFSP